MVECPPFSPENLDDALLVAKLKNPNAEFVYNTLENNTFKELAEKYNLKIVIVSRNSIYGLGLVSSDLIITNTLVLKYDLETNIILSYLSITTDLGFKYIDDLIEKVISSPETVAMDQYIYYIVK